MTSSLLLLDLVLALALVAIGTSVLLARDLFQSIVLFIVYGMLMGIAWCRLQAVDIALAEVAIGAGLTGALLLNTLAATHGRSITPSPVTPLRPETDLTPADAKFPRRPLAFVFVVVLFTLFLASGLASVIVPLANSSSAPRIAIAEALPDSGADNPVTAVLLNFRAYDTLLEVGVLVAAVLAVLGVSKNSLQSEARPVGPVLEAFARLLVPLAIMVATYVLWIGAKAPGGAFQAAAILGAAGVLSLVCGAKPPNGAHRGWRVLLTGGLWVFLLVGACGVVAGGWFLELSPGWASVSIMLVETALTVSIALILIVLFDSTSPSHSADHTVGIGIKPSPLREPHPRGGKCDGRAMDVQEASP